MEKIELLKNAALFIGLISATILLAIIFQPRQKKTKKYKKNRKKNELTLRVSDYKHKLPRTIDRKTRERLIEYEIKRMPGISREKAERWAKDRYERDRR
ncbi:MAG: hypothetical protein GQ532_18470 [Methylomarinum sp.]|nr:hypothetical protein [Methylomarinum sp.]